MTDDIRLADLDLSRRLERAPYEDRLAELQLQLVRIQQAYFLQGRAAAIVFEGWDASGKGGTIRRMSAVMDPRNFKVWPIGAPRPHYLDRHWLLRFMERVPPRGEISVFDRSWYGRVLVERVEGLTPEPRWRKGYREIGEFERMLVNDGTRIAKLFFPVSPKEQLRRFEARLKDPLKRWKLTTEDFRNHARRADYEAAIDEMFAETSVPDAPWCAIPAEDKKYARIAALEKIVARLGDGVNLAPPPPDSEVEAVARRLGLL